ncbi:ribokinase [Polymorphum gilvum]|uniref:Ribokinase n=1 Tax=Polymorphum gilvum (strain LMG 25793 / CGMCC 1.9160 / SL003B-26A1) TaxID=991905 RepID=F2J2S5_POLGS|nr:ribokinase [Polymorphum gilvum]ADZ72099.1 Ribokinase [Polymorphum gilvum SL003B-26A1]
MIVVFGSVNLDLVVAVPRLPAAGETVVGPDHQSFPGGKGANQALAACRAGAEVALVGAVGTDAFAAPALAGLKAVGVDLSAVRVLDGATGLAMIGVDAAGENLILVASGVNARVDAAWLDGRLGPVSTLLMQVELPLPALQAATARARAAGSRIVLNAAPVAGPGVGDLAAAADVVVVNESETADLGAVLGLPTDPEGFARTLAAAGRAAVVTLGAGGVLAHDGSRPWRLRPPPTAVVDTTGAGDAFCGALAAALDRGAGLGRALAEGVAAGSLACMATGAQSSAPDAARIAALADTLEAC